MHTHRDVLGIAALAGLGVLFAFQVRTARRVEEMAKVLVEADDIQELHDAVSDIRGKAQQASSRIDALKDEVDRLNASTPETVDLSPISQELGSIGGIFSGVSTQPVPDVPSEDTVPGSDTEPLVEGQEPEDEADPEDGPDTGVKPDAGPVPTDSPVPTDEPPVPGDEEVQDDAANNTNEADTNPGDTPTTPSGVNLDAAPTTEGLGP